MSERLPNQSEPPVIPERGDLDSIYTELTMFGIASDRDVEVYRDGICVVRLADRGFAVDVFVDDPAAPPELAGQVRYHIVTPEHREDAAAALALLPEKRQEIPDPERARALFDYLHTARTSDEYQLLTIKPAPYGTPRTRPE